MRIMLNIDYISSHSGGMLIYGIVFRSRILMESIDIHRQRRQTNSAISLILHESDG